VTTPAARAAIRPFIESEATYATTLVAVLVDNCGAESLNWEPEIIAAEMRDRFDARIPQDNLDKIQALALAMTTNQFFTSLDVFMNVCNALGGDGVDFNQFDPADVMEMCWAVTEVLLNQPVQQPLTELFSTEIQLYAGLQARIEGFHELPKPLSLFAQFDDGMTGASEMLDADMFKAYFDDGKAGIQDTEQAVKARMQALMGQLSRIPLVHGDQEAWRKRGGTGLTVIGQRS
jgi:hypothetical protein